jgi:hypothetical protein
MTASDLGRSAHQAAREGALVEVADVLLDFERVIESATKAQQKAVLTDGCDDLARVLGTSVRNLEAARKDLFQGAYFSADQPRLV